jgi:hypothetical protein
MTDGASQDAREECAWIKLMLLRRVHVGRTHYLTVVPLRFANPAPCMSYSIAENS